MIIFNFFLKLLLSLFLLAIIIIYFFCLSRLYFVVSVFLLNSFWNFRASSCIKEVRINTTSSSSVIVVIIKL